MRGAMHVISWRLFYLRDILPFLIPVPNAQNEEIDFKQ